MQVTASQKTKVILPVRRIHKIPRLLMADAYTLGSNDFEAPKAKEKSVYYVVFRRELVKTNDTLYTKGDNRMIFAGLPRIIEELFYEPITHTEIDETKACLATFKVTTRGLKPYSFPEAMWRRIVDEFNGRPPIMIEAFPDGSVVYPGEPIIQITSKEKGMGILGAWFEEALLHVWAPSERLTQSEHWLKQMVAMVLDIDPAMPLKDAYFVASTMLHDFGARAAICEQETEILGMYGLISFGGTDSMSAAYLAYKNSGGAPGTAVSVKALAHRNVQAYEHENDCYVAAYENAEDGDINSYVGDCYDYFFATENYLLPLALRSVKENNGKVVVSRPDSGNALEQVMWTLNLAVKNGLYTEQVINGKTWKCGTFLKFIEGDGMTFEAMYEIWNAVRDAGFLPWTWGLFGQGGGQRNFLKRDNFGAKYALCSVGEENRGVVKLSDTLGKTTLPGPFKVLRTPEALAAKKTIVNINEPGETALILYYDGSNLGKPFGPGMDEDNAGYLQVKARVRDHFHLMPLNLDTTHGAPASDRVLEDRKDLIRKNAPNKDVNNY
jgi:nicotinamide phosphoribosyltransferase